MRTLTGFAIVVFVWVCLGNRGYPAEPALKRTVVSRGPAVLISAEKGEYTPDEAIAIDFKLKNQTGKPLFVQVPYRQGHLCRIVVTNKETKVEKVIKYPAGPWLKVFYRSVRIDPEFFYGSMVGMGKLEAGRYEMQIRYDSHPATAERGVWTGSVLSNKIFISVRKPQVKQPAEIVHANKTGTRTERYDTDGDGMIDAETRFVGFGLAYIIRDMNADGKSDMWQDFGRKIIIRDSNFDNVPDMWQYFQDGKVFKTGYDADGDGLPDRFEDN